MGQEKNMVNSQNKTEPIFELHNYLSEIIDYLPDATMVIDKEGKLIIWNKSMEKMTGVTAAEVLNKKNYEYAIPFYKERRPVLLDLALKPEETDIAKRYPFIKKEGDILTTEVFVPTFGESGAWLWARAKPIHDAAGRVIGSIEIVRDVTERHLSEEALKQRADELEKFNKVMVGRETKMAELKEEIVELKEKLQKLEKNK